MPSAVSTKLVTVIVDKAEFKISAGPWIGADLRKALGIPDDRDLYEINPHGDDLLIEAHTEIKVIRNGTRFFTVPRHITPGSH